MKDDLTRHYNSAVNEQGNAIFAEIGRLSPDMRAEYDNITDRQQSAGQRYAEQLDVGRDAQVGLKKQQILGGSAIQAYPERERGGVAQLQAEQAVGQNIQQKMEALGEQHRNERVTFLEGARMERTQNLRSEFKHEAEHDLGE